MPLHSRGAADPMAPIAKSQRAAEVPRTQRRGVERRERLLRAARDLIARRPLSSVTYAAVCERASVPASSAHHFYPDLDAIFRALLEAHRAEMDAALMRPLRARDTRSWQAIVECLVDRAARYHRTHPVGAKLAVEDGGKFVGSVSGGCVEGAVIEEALAAIKDGKPRLLDFGVTNEQAWEVGLACGGKVQVFVEKVE